MQGDNLAISTTKGTDSTSVHSKLGDLKAIDESVMEGILLHYYAEPTAVDDITDSLDLDNSLHLIDSQNQEYLKNIILCTGNFEKIKLKKLSNAEMINLLGDQILIQRKRKLQSNEFFYDYLKKEIKPKRKMGHLTILKK